MMANYYTENVLAITDEEVSKDWQLGLLRAMGSVVAGSALPSDHTGPWGQPVAGTARAHLAYPGLGSTETPCTITEVYSITEDSFEEWEHNSFGDDNSRSRTELRALATCACGRLVRKPVAMAVSVGELISTITSAV